MTYAGSLGRPRCGTGRQVRRVGLQQQQLVRHAPRGVLQVDGAAVGDVAGEGAVPAALDAPRRAAPRRRSSAAPRSRGASSARIAEAVVGGLAAVDDDGQLEPPRQGELAVEGRELRLARRAVAEPVEARLADRHAARARRALRSISAATSSPHSAAWCGCSPAVVQTSSCGLGERGRLGHLPLAGADRDQPRRRRPRGRGRAPPAGSSLQLVTCVWVSITRWARRCAGTAPPTASTRAPAGHRRARRRELPRRVVAGADRLQHPRRRCRASRWPAGSATTRTPSASVARTTSSSAARAGSLASVQGARSSTKRLSARTDSHAASSASVSSKRSTCSAKRSAARRQHAARWRASVAAVGTTPSR